MQITMIKLSDTEFFKACLDPQAKAALFQKHKLIDEEFKTDLTEQQFWNHFSNKCRFCDKDLTPETITKVSTYWSQVVCPCHKDCKVAGAAYEAYECQVIDSDCNWCAGFQRDNTRKMKGNSGGYGKCLLTNLPTTCISNGYSGRDCFKHRKAITKDNPLEVQLKIWKETHVW